MVSINTNLSSLIVQGNLTSATTGLNKAIERLSTGYKINHASDNAANYSIANTYESKLSSYEVAASNVQSGLDLLSVAQDTISTMQDHGARLQALITQARNGTYGQQSLNAMTQEAGAIISEIQRMYTNAEYNNINLFDNFQLPAWTKDYNINITETTSDFMAEFTPYTDDEIKAMTKLSEIDSFESGKKYSISTLDELQKLAQMVNNGQLAENAEIVLVNDINMSSIDNWEPIGNSLTYLFKGTFNGNGHVLSNLSINSDSTYVGLFGILRNAKIMNLGVENANVKGSNDTGILAGAAAYSCIIENCWSTGKVSGTNYVGGLVGYCQSNSIVDKCYTKGTANSGSFMGGIVGCLDISNIKNSYSIMDVNSKGKFVGGIVGQVRNENETHYIKNVIYAGQLITTSKASGTLIGAIYAPNQSNLECVTVRDCVCTDFSDNKKIGCWTKSKTGLGDIPDYDFSEFNSNIAILKENNLSLQVGINGDESSRITFDTKFDFDLRSILRDIKSDRSYSIVNEYMSTLSAKATDLGAVSNRLESSLESIAVNMQNLGDSLSTVKDVDMAEVSSEYIKKQILQQASATLLATANQSPAIALQLI